MAQVNLVLLADVENLGLAGESVRVAPGYARNYLLPRGLAAKATAATLRQLEARRGKIEEQRKQDLVNAQALALKLAEVELSLAAQASGDDQLFGSVTARNIAEKLAEAGFQIDHSRIKLDPPIKTLGSFQVEVKLHADVLAQVKVWVVRG